MFTAIMGWVGSAVSALSSLVNAALKWAGIFFAYRLGKRAVRQEAAEDAAKTKDKQLEIMAQPKLRRDALLKRMFDRKRPD